MDQKKDEPQRLIESQVPEAAHKTIIAICVRHGYPYQSPNSLERRMNVFETWVRTIGNDEVYEFHANIGMGAARRTIRRVHHRSPKEDTISLQQAVEACWTEIADEAIELYGVDAHQRFKEALRTAPRTLFEDVLDLKAQLRSVIDVMLLRPEKRNQSAAETILRGMRDELQADLLRYSSPTGRSPQPFQDPLRNEYQAPAGTSTIGLDFSAAEMRIAAEQKFGYNERGVTTGRFSSKEPNLSNAPKTARWDDSGADPMTDPPTTQQKMLDQESVESGRTFERMLITTWLRLRYPHTTNPIAKEIDDLEHHKPVATPVQPEPRVPLLIARDALVRLEERKAIAAWLRERHEIANPRTLAHAIEDGAHSKAPRTFEELIEASSFGTPEAKALRESVPPEVVEKIMQRVAELEPPTDAPTETKNSPSSHPENTPTAPHFTPEQEAASEAQRQKLLDTYDKVAFEPKPKPTGDTTPPNAQPLRMCIVSPRYKGFSICGKPVSVNPYFASIDHWYLNQHAGGHPMICEGCGSALRSAIEGEISGERISHR